MSVTYHKIASIPIYKTKSLFFDVKKGSKSGFYLFIYVGDKETREINKNHYSQYISLKLSTLFELYKYLQSLDPNTLSLNEKKDIKGIVAYMGNKFIIERRLSKTDQHEIRFKKITNDGYKVEQLSIPVEFWDKFLESLATSKKIMIENKYK